MSEPADEVLVPAVLDGDQEAFRVLVERYEKPYLLYATRMLGSRAEAEDVVQESFLSAYENLDTCAHPERFASWCFHIVRNRCHDRLRRPDRRSDGSEALEDIPSDQAGPEESAARTELRAAILKAAASLSPLLREAFVLYHETGLTYPEIAHRLDASESAVKMRVKRAREELRDSLAAHGDQVRT